MIIIGEKINGSIPAVAEAIKDKDAEAIRERARSQAEAGAHFLDCCAAVSEEKEAEALRWMIDCIEEVTELPIAVDSSSTSVLAEVFSHCKRPGIINSVSGEEEKLDRIFPLIAHTEWKVICLLSDRRGVPKSAAERLEILEKILKKAEEYEVCPEQLYIDPLAEMLCLSENGVREVLETIESIRRSCPEIHITAAVSNVSFELPARRLLHAGFLVLAMNAGLDSAILDPTDENLRGMICATEALLGRDENCMDYIRAYRAGVFGTGKQEQ